MREKRVFLKNSVDVAAVGGEVVYFLAVKIHVAGVRRLKAADDTQGRGFSAAGRPEEGYKLFVIDVEIKPGENRLTVKFLGDVLKFDDFLHNTRPLSQKKDKRLYITCL